MFIVAGHWWTVYIRVMCVFVLCASHVLPHFTHEQHNAMHHQPTTSHIIDKKKKNRKHYYLLNMMCLFSFTIQLELTIDHLPPINEPLVCAFTTLDKPTIYTNATRKRNGVNCTTPRTDLLPQIAQGKRKFQHFSTRSLFLSLSLFCCFASP